MNDFTAPPIANASRAKGYVVDPAASSIQYHLVHALHRVDGRSKTIHGKAVVQRDGAVLAAVVVPVASFRSGDPDRDARALEALGPAVGFKGQCRLDPSASSAIQVTMEGELTLHGIRRPMRVPLMVHFKPDGTAQARGSFDVSLENHAIERPSLLLIKVEDACRIELDLALRPVEVAAPS